MPLPLGAIFAAGGGGAAAGAGGMAGGGASAGGLAGIMSMLKMLLGQSGSLTGPASGQAGAAPPQKGIGIPNAPTRGATPDELGFGPSGLIFTGGSPHSIDPTGKRLQAMGFLLSQLGAFGKK